ncbi:hypothetical protein PR202_gb06054 [Eleusine coracana subsp. coracana]|uniref:Uncharacterized protein n=1 Tax=Eleusine coracana subsp. coracana TaxID=191504 RepID=A0AAV5E6W6_ELECO|nr:hypothetical protein QOZ80_2BG0153180 [Eleusine coracana subsp. coracana]GJN18849.1 hypothetical protein PR202_gb06054 [Eleusine coracana subsp. coracana]
MAAAPSLLFITSSVEPLLFSASLAAGNSRRGRRGGSVRSSPASKPRLPSDIDLQDSLTNVRAILLQHRKSDRKMMATIDNLKRLCIDHYFQDEIGDAMAACMNLVRSDDLRDATLALRLTREAGHDVSADKILWRFTDDSGEFNLALSKDIPGLLSLHDMSHLNMGGEASLYMAKEFSSKHLTSSIKFVEPSLAKYVRQSLDHPYHLSLTQYKARHHLSYLQTQPNRTIAVEELAIAEFQFNKQLHQTEMQEIKRWWMDLGLTREIPVARDQVLKWYMWAVTILQESSFSRYRVEITKIISFIYVVDDIFDLVGTPEELSRFTDAIKMWDIVAADSLVTYMRSCYNGLYTVTNAIADMTEKEHGLNPINHLKKAWATLFDGFMVETKWLATNQVPAAEDYLKNGVITSGMPLLFAHILSLLGHDHAASNDAARVASCPAKILRLHDDMGSAKDEAQDGLDGSYKDLYLMENLSCSPAEAEEHMLRLIEREWEELNRECFRRRSFPSSFTQACLNATRMISVMYGYNKEHRLPVLEDYMRTLLL